MALQSIDTVTLLFPNQEWSSVTDAQFEVATLQPNISFTQHLDNDLRTLSTPVADRDGSISGFLYVPDLSTVDDCYNVSQQYVPANVTRQANLPPTDFSLVALAPWINVECTLSYLASARRDPARAFLFYLPNTTTSPPPSDSRVWNLGDGGGWKSQNHIPVYAITGTIGSQLMRQLSLYSGNMTKVPYGHEISELPSVDPRDYVRIYTQLTIDSQSAIPSLWAFLLIVVAALLIILGLTSAIMHIIQRSRRNSLRRRITSGEINLEALGIKRMTVPQTLIDRLPLFTYSDEGDKVLPTSPIHKRKSTSSIFEASIGKHTSTTHGESQADEANLSPTQEPPHVMIMNDSTSNRDSVLLHKFLPYSQPTCPICLEDYQSGLTEIRELPCGHIFHPVCIDTFLVNNSSLCPMCKKSVLPVGYCPTKVTNNMVRRERNLRRLRSRVTMVDEEAGGRTAEAGTAQCVRKRFHDLTIIIKRTLIGSPRRSGHHTMPSTPHPVFMTSIAPDRTESWAGSALRGAEISTQEDVRRRAQVLATEQASIADPDMQHERRRPKWRQTLLQAFPGF